MKCVINYMAHKVWEALLPLPGLLLCLALCVLALGGAVLLVELLDSLGWLPYFLLFAFFIMCLVFLYWIARVFLAGMHWLRTQYGEARAHCLKECGQHREFRVGDTVKILYNSKRGYIVDIHIAAGAVLHDVCGDDRSMYRNQLTGEICHWEEQ